jgi:hypothetical protein
MPRDYPAHIFFPRSSRPPEWVKKLEGAFVLAKETIDTRRETHLSSDQVLAILRPQLESIGFAVESGKQSGQKIHRPVFFGEMGTPDVQYEIDAYDEGNSVVLEVEAGRAMKGNAFYKDIVQMSLMAEVKYAVIAMPLEYRYMHAGRKVVNYAYRDGKDVLEAIWSSRRVVLPFTGMLLIGY